MGKRESVKDDGNACRTGRGCKLLSDKGKAVLFTALSTGNGDKVVSVAGCACVGAGGGRQVLPDGFFMPLHGGGGFVRDAVCVVFRLCQAVRCAGMMAQTGRFFRTGGPEGGGYSAIGVVLVVSVPVCVVPSRSLRVFCASASPAMAAFWSQ